MRKAASAVEYVILIITVVTALLAMRLFLIRSIAGKWRQPSDSIGFDQQYNDTGGGGVYDCRVERWYTCQSGYRWMVCDNPKSPYCLPAGATCYDLLGFGLSTISMADACSKAVNEARAQAPICGVTQWIGWWAGKYYPEGAPQYYCGVNPP